MLKIILLIGVLFFTACNIHDLKLPTYHKVGSVYIHKTQDKTSCNLQPRVREFLKKDGWKIVENEDDADYGIYLSTKSCSENTKKAYQKVLEDVRKANSSKDLSPNSKEQFNPNATSAMYAGTTTTQYNSKTGASMMVIGAIMGLSNHKKVKYKKRYDSSFGYRNRITVYHADTKKTKSMYISNASHSPATDEEVEDLIDDMFD
jgi:hypothetical protein